MQKNNLFLKKILALALISILSANSAHAFLFFGKKKKKEPQNVEQPQQIQEEEKPLLWEPDSEIQKYAEDETALKNSVFVKDIVIEGNNLIDENEIKANMILKPGDAFTRETTSENLKLIYNMGYFSEKMRAVPVKIDENNVILKIYVEENQPIVGFTINGNKSVKQGEILACLKDLEGKPQNIKHISEAIKNIEDAKKLWLELAIEDGREIPLPESSLDEYSGQFKIRIPKSLHRDLAKNAKKEGVSMNQYCVYLLSSNNALASNKKNKTE